MTTTAPTSAPLEATEATASCTLDIGGMTCASCVGRVEKALRRVPGRGHRRGQPGHRGRHRPVPTRPGRRRRADRRGHPRRLHRHPATRGPDPNRPTRRGPRAPRVGTARRQLTAAQAQVAGHPRRGSRPDGADVRAAVPGHDGLVDAGDPGRRHRRAVLGGRGHLPRRLGRRASPLDEHEHARRTGDRRRLRLQRFRHPLAGHRRTVGAAAARVLRDLAGDPRARPGRQVDGGEGEEADRRGDHRPGRAGPEDRPGAARRRRDRHPGRAGRRRRPGPRPPR